VTPFEIDDLPLEHPVRVSLALDGWVVSPHEAIVSIPSSTRRTSATFTLKRGRAFHLETTPSGASVDVGSRRLRELTPLVLPPIVLGETATISIKLDGYLPARSVVRALAQTATVVSVTLEAAREIDVVSEPPGADVYVDGAMRGHTPVYDLLVPANRAFKVKVQRRGYKSWAQTLAPKKLKNRVVEADLDILPLLAMPMSKEDRKEARELDQKLNAINASLNRTRAELKKSEKHLADLESSPQVFIGRIADAQRDADELRARLEEIDNERTELEATIDIFRQRVMSGETSGDEPR
jgi:hypothetical protein